MASTFSADRLKEDSSIWLRQKMWGNLRRLAVWLSTLWASQCLLCALVLCSTWGKTCSFSPLTVRAEFQHITINKKLISLCWHGLNLSLRPPARTHLNSERSCIDGPLTTEGHLYVKEHIPPITRDNHRLQGSWLHTVKTDRTVKRGWGVHFWCTAHLYSSHLYDTNPPMSVHRKKLSASFEHNLLPCGKN